MLSSGVVLRSLYRSARRSAHKPGYSSTTVRSFSVDAAPLDPVSTATIPKTSGAAKQDADLYSRLKYFPLMVFNPVTVGYFIYTWNQHKVAGDVDDPINDLQGSGFIAQTRQARRDSLKDFKEHVWGVPDPKLDYDAETFARTNYTSVVKPLRGGLPREPSAEPLLARKSSRIGLYDSDGASGDPSRAPSGIAAYRKEAAEAKEALVNERGF